jgi:hypothetical protein
MGKHPEAEDRESTVVDLESYRRRREIIRHNTSANQQPRGTGAEGGSAPSAPVEGNSKD